MFDMIAALHVRYIDKCLQVCFLYNIQFINKCARNCHNVSGSLVLYVKIMYKDLDFEPFVV